MNLAQMLLYLDILAYFPEFSRNGYRTVGEFTDDYLSHAPSDRPTTMFSDYKSDDETGVVNLIKKISCSKRLRELKIIMDSSDTNKFTATCLAEDIKNNNDITERRIYVILGANYREHLYESFYGQTSTWADNFLGAVQSDTAEQKSILRFYDRATAIALKGLNKDTKFSIIVSGHSKAGNFAQYITVRRNNVHRCYSFDGQGFSDKFLKKYGSCIKANSWKIISICPDMSLTGSLLGSLDGIRKYYIRTGYLHDKSISLLPIQCHIPTTLLDKDFQMKPYAKGINSISDMLHFISGVSINVVAAIPFINVERGLKGLGESIRHIFKNRIKQGISCLINKDSLAFLIIGTLMLVISAPVYITALLIDNSLNC